MENYTITKEQIKKLSTQDQIVEEYLNEWFPEALKKELEIGKWYIVEGDKCGQSGRFLLANYSGIENMNYGIDFVGNWSTDLSLFHNDLDICTRLATEEEISNILIKEAVKRGFKDGAYANNSMIEFNGCTPSVSKRCKLDFKQGYSSFNIFNDLRIKGTTPCNSAFIIFKDGIWASILNEVTLNYDQIAEKFGIDVEQLRIIKL